MTQPCARALEDRTRTPYYYRRELTAVELLPAVGIGLASGLVAFYLSALLLQRTPLAEPSAESPSRRHRRAMRRPTLRGARG